MSTRYYLVSWTDHQRKGRGRPPTTREYGTAGSKQAAIRLAERLLPPDVEYVITTLSRRSRHGPVRVMVGSIHRRTVRCPQR